MSAPLETRNDERAGLPVPSGFDDVVTGLEGPDFWRLILGSELARSLRYERPMTVVLVEIEGLDDLLAAWGAEAARATLRQAAACLRRSSRTSDHCTRIGPARFGIVLTETDEIAAINFVERVREDGPRMLPRGAGALRFRFGWASPHPGECAEAIMQRAEARLRADT